MNSLRSRLIAGAALIAVIPLALSMFLLSRQIETTVRRQAEARLGAALGGLQSDLRAETDRIAQKLRLLGEDPVLKRLYLVGGDRRELTDYLAERKFLLGLDVLYVADTEGVVEADAGSSLRAAVGGRDPERPVEVRAPRALSGIALVPVVGDSGLAVIIGAPIRYARRSAGTVIGGLILDGAYLERLKQVGGMELLLRDGEDRTMARTLDATVALPARADAPAGTASRVVVGGRSYLAGVYPLALGEGTDATVTGLVPTEGADATIGALRITSLVLGGVGLLIAVLLGSIWSAQVSRPVERLAAFSRTVARGEWDEPLQIASVRELDTLVDALETMRRDLATYRDKLVTSERQAAWSQMARRVAHEIRNPLTPIAVSIEDVRRSYEQGRDDFPEILRLAVRTIAEEVSTMNRLLQEFTDFARVPAPVIAPCRVAALLEEVGTLFGREIAEGRLAVGTPAPDLVLDADAGQLRQVLVNLAKNAVEAVRGNAPPGRASLSALADGDDVVFTVQDDGPGLSEEQRANLFVPGYSTKPDGSGLGLTIVERIVSDHDGTIAVESRPGAGTVVRVRVPREAERRS